jgi:hypothetical protein
MSTKPVNSAKTTSPNHLERQLGLYSLAAAVAGVSVLALGQTAAAEVVVTKTTIPIPMSPYNAPEPVEISLANDGINNLSFELLNYTSGRNLLVFGVNPKDELVTGGTWSAYALALKPGTKIGQAPDFFYNDLVELSATSSIRYCKGYWAPNLKNGFIGCGTVTDKYLGVRFPIDGEFHYGWIRLTVRTTSQTHGPHMTAAITEYAYETIPDEPIYAGSTEEPAAEVQVPANIQNAHEPTLGMLALGAYGLPLWRKESSASNC